MDRTLESIIGGSLATESDTDIPQMDVTEDDLTETVVDGINEAATIEQFLNWERNTTEHFKILQSLEHTDALLLSAEDGVMKKIGNAIVDAAKRLITLFKNFILRVVNYLRSIGMKGRCEIIGKLHSKISKELIDKHGANKTFIDPILQIAVQNLFYTYYRSAGFSRFMDDDTLSMNTTADEITKFIETNREKLKNKSETAVNAVNKYISTKLYDSIGFYTKDYESALGKFNRLIANAGPVVALTKEEKAVWTQKVKQMHAMYSLCLKVTPQWISLTNFTYRLCKEADKAGT